MTPPIVYPNFDGLEHLTAAAMICDDKFFILYINPSAEALLELSNDQACQQNIQFFLDGIEFFVHAAETAKKTQSAFRENEFFIRSKQNKTICVTLTVSSINNGDNFLIEMIQMDQQVKIAKEERMFIQQQANAELLRNLAHEVRNPLGGLRGAAQLLEKELDSKNLKEYTSIIISEADRLQKLMNKLLTPHQLPDYQEANIHEVIERVRTLIVSEFEGEINFVRDYDVSLPEFTADREKLIQAILNIARNAVQAMMTDSSKKSLLKIVTRSERQIVFHKKKHSTAIRINIIDNGPGIPQNIKDKIFYPLVSGSQNGTGLGLSLAQNFISLHKGIIELETKLGRTCFSIILPIKNDLNNTKGL
jgi:two-component system nitrogen regulation sensor histidine kinase GlnL